MNERLLALLLQQALLLSVAVVLIGALRPLLLKALGAVATYAAWLLVPAVLLTPLLPRPAQAPLRVVMQAVATADTTAAAASPAAPAHPSALWLVLWLGGTAAVIALQAWRQWRLSRWDLRLPAGSSPALIGLLRPRVMLPTDFEQRFSPAECELILAHEQVHRDRLDNLWNLLASMLTALHWWNPLAWWAACRMQADQELACDAAVLATRPGALADYTRALLAAHDLTPHGAPLASRWGTTHPLVERIAMLSCPSSMNRRRALALALLAGSAVGLAYAAQTPPSVATREDAYVRLTVFLIVQEGNLKRRTTQEWIGKAGERMHLEMNPTTGAAGFSVDLSASGFRDKGFDLDISAQGLPASLKFAGHQGFWTWDEPSLFESTDEAGTSRLTLFAIGARTPTPPAALKPKS